MFPRVSKHLTLKTPVWSKECKLLCFFFSIDALVCACFENIPLFTLLGYQEMKHLKFIGEELRHAENTTALVVKQVSCNHNQNKT